jgi:uncharacterized protein (TIGR03435 family)
VYAPDDTAPGALPLAGGTSIFTAMQEKLGFKPSRPRERRIVVIDHVERPSEN